MTMTVKIGMKWPQAKEYWQPQEAGESMDHLHLDFSSVTQRFLLLTSREPKKIMCVVLSHQISAAVICYSSNRKFIHKCKSKFSPFKIFYKYNIIFLQRSSTNLFTPNSVSITS